MIYLKPFSRRDLLVIAGHVPHNLLDKEDIKNREIVLIEPFIRTFKDKNTFSIFTNNISKSKIDYHKSNGVNASCYIYFGNKSGHADNAHHAPSIARKYFSSLNQFDTKSNLIINALKFISMENPSSVVIYGLSNKNSKFSEKDIEKLQESLSKIKNVVLKECEMVVAESKQSASSSDKKILEIPVYTKPKNAIVIKQGDTIFERYNIAEDHGVDKNSWFYKHNFTQFTKNIHEDYFMANSTSSLDHLFYEKLGIDNRKKDFVLMLINPTTTGLSEVVSSDRVCDLLVLRTEASFGTAMFTTSPHATPEQKREQEEAFILGYALELHKFKNYKKFVFFHGDLTNPSLCLNSLSDLEKVEGVKVCEYDELKNSFSARYWNLITTRKFSFVKKFDKLFPSTRVGVDFDSILNDAKNLKVKDMILKVVELYNAGFEIYMICATKTEDEVVGIIGKKIHHKFFKNVRMPDDKGTLSMVCDVLFELSDF